MKKKKQQTVHQTSVNTVYLLCIVVGLLVLLFVTHVSRIGKQKPVAKTPEQNVLQEKESQPHKASAVTRKSDAVFVPEEEESDESEEETTEGHKIKRSTAHLNHVGIYLSASSTNSKIDGYIDSVKDAGGNTIIFDVKEGKTLYDSKAVFANEHGLVLPLYQLSGAVKKIQDSGLTAIARFVAAKDSPLAIRFSDAQIRHPGTNRSVGGVWVDLSKDVVHQYNRELLQEIAATGIDEINIDYIRYPTEYPQYLIGLTGNEKADRVESFLQMARDVINETNPRVRLGISTFAILGWNYDINVEPLGQDVVRFAPLVDVISPMAYPQTFSVGHYYRPGVDPRSRMYYLVYRTMEGYRELLGDEAYKLRPWIQGYSVTTKNVRDQIDAVIDAGSCGFTVWNANNNYRPTLNAMSGWELPEECQS